MTEVFGALDNSNIDGSTSLLEFEDRNYIYISGFEFFEYMTSNKIIDYISLMGNIMTPYVFTVRSRYTYFITKHCKFLQNDKIEESTLLNSSNDSLDPYDYYFSKNGLDCFRKLLEFNRIHSSWPGVECGFSEDEEDVEKDVAEDVNVHELEYTDGSNEFVKNFNQKRVICVERDSDYYFKQCGHHL